GGVSLWRRLVQVVRRSSGANATEAERILLEADFGVEATQQILAAVSGATEGDFRAAVERAVTDALVVDALGDPGALARAATPPTVILVFGVNGVGKTTTVAKLAARLARDGRSVLLAAADTFRAGATEQLQAWAGRLGVPAVTGTGDPAAVAFDAIAAARARGADTVLVDTAGRLHTEDRLLEELKKMVRVVAKLHPGARHGSPGAWWTRRDAPAHDVGEVLEGRRSQAGRCARAARDPHGRRPVVSRAAPLPRCHHGHAPRPGARGRGRDVRGTVGEHRRSPHPQGPAGVPGGAARRRGQWRRRAR